MKHALICSLGVLASLTACGTEVGDLAPEDDAPPVVDPAVGTQDICVDCGNGSSGDGNPGAMPDLRVDFIGDCPRNSSWQLIVRIKNWGPAPAGPSTTRVTWYYGNSVDRMPYVDIPTGALAPGQTVTFYRPIPESCFDPDCSFAITADVHRAVSERLESNNTKTGICQR